MQNEIDDEIKMVEQNWADGLSQEHIIIGPVRTTQSILVDIIKATADYQSTFQILWPTNDAKGLAQRLRMMLSRMRTERLQRTGKKSNFVLRTMYQEQEDEKTLIFFFRQKTATHQLLDILNDIDITPIPQDMNKRK
jgi:hypothetical protein